MSWGRSSSPISPRSRAASARSSVRSTEHQTDRRSRQAPFDRAADRLGVLGIDDGTGLGKHVDVSDDVGVRRSVIRVEVEPGPFGGQHDGQRLAHEKTGRLSPSARSETNRSRMGGNSSSSYNLRAVRTELGVLQSAPVAVGRPCVVLTTPSRTLPSAYVRLSNVRDRCGLVSACWIEAKSSSTTSAVIGSAMRSRHVAGFRSLVHRRAAVDHKGLPGDEVAVGRCEERHGSGQVFGQSALA